MHSADFANFFSYVIEELNDLSLKYIQKKDTETAYEILLWCENMTVPERFHNFPLLRNLTYNNMGCLYRRVGKLQYALNYLREALGFIMKTKSTELAPKTYLNLCAVLSQMGK